MNYGLDPAAENYGVTAFGYGFEQTGTFAEGNLACTNVNECDHIGVENICLSPTAICTDKTPVVDTCVDFTDAACPGDLGGFWGSCPINLGCETVECSCPPLFKNQVLVFELDGVSHTLSG